MCCSLRGWFRTSSNIPAFLPLLLLFVACFAVPAEAQTRFEPGYIVLREDGVAADTVRGEIVNADWIRTPPSITFRTLESDAPISYDASEIAAFGVSGDQYESYDVIIDRRPTRPREATPETSFEKERVFLLKLAEGPLTLFSYRDRRTNFFIQTPGALPNGLTYFVSRTYRNGKEYQVTSTQYRDQLEYVKTPACADASTRNLSYTLDDLVEFVNTCNENAESDLAVNAKRRSSYRVEHHAGLVLSVSAIRSRLLGPSLTNIGPGVGAAYNLVLTSNTATPTLAFLVGLTLSRTRYPTASGTLVRQVNVVGSSTSQRVSQRLDQTRSVDVTLLGLSFSGQRRFLDGPVRPFVEGGLTVDYPIMHESEGELVITTESATGDGPSTATLDFGGSSWSMLHFGARIGVGAQWNRWSVKAHVRHSIEQRNPDVRVSLFNADELDDAAGFTPRNRVVGIEMLYQF